MRCPYCNAELVQDGCFCQSCGRPVRVTGKQNVQNASNLSGADRKRKQDSDDDIRGSLSRNSGGSRSVSAGSRKENAELFKLFEKLIRPVEALEILDQKRAEMAADYQNKRAYEEEKRAEAGKGWNYVIIGGVIGLFVGQLGFGTALIGMFIGFIVKLYNNAQARKTAKEMKERNDALEIENREKAREYDEQEKKIIGAIAPCIACVPRSYRTSDRLRSFVDDYQNYRVDNLKEAVLNCDKKEFRSSELASLGRIQFQNQQTMNELRRMPSQLDDIYRWVYW